MQIKFDKISYSPSRTNLHGVSAFEDLSFELKGPGLTGIMGGRSSGKTAILYLLAGILRPDRGHILIDGEDIFKKKRKRGDTGYSRALVMCGSERLLYEKTVERELGRALRSSALSAEEKNERIALALDSVGMEAEKFLKIAPAALSESERYKISLAAALVAGPDILLLDEPLKMLDAAGKKMLLALIARLGSEGCHVILTTNDADFLAENANTVLVMEGGRLIRSGSAKSVFVDYFDLIRNRIPVPAVKMAVQKLRERDINMPSNVVEYEQFIDRLKIIMWRKQR